MPELQLPASIRSFAVELGIGTVATDSIPPGTYREITLRVDDAESHGDDEGDDENGGDDDGSKSADFTAALSAARAAFSDWPQRASLVVAGTLVKAGAKDTVSFRSYFNARLRVRMPLDPALVINASGASRDLTIDVKPAEWFKSGDAVIDLSTFDFTKTGRVTGIDLRHGFVARVDR
ncbi:MAG: hypothetical protein U0163_05165 [Gemmatimonadaceae bacterium]